MNGVLISLGFASLFRRYFCWFIPFVFASICLSHSSIPWGVLAVCLFAYCMSEYRNPWFLTTIPGTLLVGWGFEYGRFFKLDGSGRWTGYAVFMGDWWNSGHRIFGLGLGSFGALSRGISLKHNFNTFEYWPWIHSDTLQSVFELGIAGAVLWIVCFFSVGKRLYVGRRSLLLSIWIGLGAAMIFDFPLRWFSMAFLTALVAAKSFQE